MSANQPPAEAGGPSSVGFRRRRAKHARIAAFLTGKPLLVGMDLAKKRHAVWVAGLDLAPIRRMMVEHSIAGLERLLEQVESDRVAGGFDRAIFLMEPTSHFWLNVTNFLEAHGQVYRLISGLAVARQREIEHITFAKGDYRDAELITKLGAAGHWVQRTLDRDPLWIALRALALEHEDLVDRENEEKMRVRSLLEIILPEMFENFDDPVRSTARKLIWHLSHPPAEIPTTYAELRERAAGALNQGYRIVLGKIRTLIARLSSGPSFGVERLMPSTLARLGFAIARYELVHEQRGDVQDRLVALYVKTPYKALLDTIPGVSPESNAVLLGLLGDPKLYDRARCLAKLAGIEPRENHSGDKDGMHSISRRGRAPLRNIVYRIILGFPRGNAELASYITRLRTRPKNPFSWFQAAMAAANKYLRLVHHMCVAGESYDPARIVPPGER